MKTVKTLTATIYVGTYNKDTNKTVKHSELRSLCQQRCDRGGLCVSYTETTFYYKDGNEPGAIIGLINYPRFPSTKKQLKEKAIDLAYILMMVANQHKVSIVFPEKTIMIDRNDDGDDNRVNDRDEMIRALGAKEVKGE
jgi:hypothetical protein